MNNSRKSPTLRSFITVTISLIVTVTLLVSTILYYNHTAKVLTENCRQSITTQLNQVTLQFIEQIDSIDSVIPLFLSNTLVLDSLEADLLSAQIFDNRFPTEKQMSNIYYSTSLASKNYTKAIYIISKNNTIFSTYTSGSIEPFQRQALMDQTDKKETRLMCKFLPSDNNTIYFLRNLFSGNNGNYLGTFIISIDCNKWMDYCTESLDTSWVISLFNSNINVISNPKMNEQSLALQNHFLSGQTKASIFQEIVLLNDSYFVATQYLSDIDLTLAVCAPKNILFRDLNITLKAYLIFLFCIILVGLASAIITSRAVTKPIEKMIYQINQISNGEIDCLQKSRMYYEFDVWSDAFNKMLKTLDTYYNEIFQKQLLLKNSEIRSLQSQMNPHFLFNILNTIAWKADMCDNEEIYQMVISLGELLKMNTLFEERDFILLSQEMEYVKFYVYLQQMRFEDKISCDIQVPDYLLNCMIPSFCIQPLVENAIVHGLEPKKGKGKLAILILEVEKMLEISITDNGIGFQSVPDIKKIESSMDASHTHIGLRNLDRRLELLFGNDSRLKISSIPNKCTTISFKIPMKGDFRDDI